MSPPWPRPAARPVFSQDALDPGAWAGPRQVLRTAASMTRMLPLHPQPYLSRRQKAQEQDDLHRPGLCCAYRRVPTVSQLTIHTEVSRPTSTYNDQVASPEIRAAPKGCRAPVRSTMSTDHLHSAQLRNCPKGKVASRGLIRSSYSIPAIAECAFRAYLLYCGDVAVKSPRQTGERRSGGRIPHSLTSAHYRRGTTIP